MHSHPFSKPPIPPYWAAPKPLNSRLRASMEMQVFSILLNSPAISKVFPLHSAQFHHFNNKSPSPPANWFQKPSPRSAMRGNCFFPQLNILLTLGKCIKTGYKINYCFGNLFLSSLKFYRLLVKLLNWVENI